MLNAKTPVTTSKTQPIALVYLIPSSKKTANLACRENIGYLATLSLSCVLAVSKFVIVCADIIL